jgi:hypothetical protein
LRVRLSWPIWMAMGLCALATACRTAAGPEELGRDYVLALREGRVADAYRLTSSDFQRRVGFAEFQRRYPDDLRRNERAGQIEGALGQIEVKAPGLAFVRGPDGWRLEELSSDPDGPAATLQRFLDAAERGDFSAAYELLSESWRARYTPERFKEDFEREPQAKERLARARQALAHAPVLREGVAEYPLGDGRAIRLVREGRAFRLAALE